MEIKSGETIEAGKGHVLIMGKPKRGKTRMLGTASMHEKLFIISCERGLSTIAGGKFDFVECDTYDEYMQALEWFMSNQKKKGYTALGIDSITRVQHYLIDKLLGGKTNQKLSFDKFAEMLATLRKQLDVLTKTEDFTTIMIVHEEDKPDNGSMNNYPLLDGAIKFEIAGYFNTVVVAQSGLDKAGKMSYYCMLQGNEKCVAGSRLKHLRGISAVPNDYKHLINTGEK